MTLSERILGVLDESPLPVETPLLVALVGDGVPHAREQVWSALARLRADGLVRSAVDRRPDARGRVKPVTVWRSANGGR